MAGITINDCPKFLTPLPQEDSHCIIVAYKFKSRTVLHIALKGVTSILNAFKITEENCNQGDSPQVFLTDKKLHWEPNFSIFEEQEHVCTDVTGGPLPRPNSAGGQSLIINKVTFSTTVDAADMTADDNFAAALQSNVNVTNVQFSSKPAFTASVS